jgi:hypothetical protein
MKVEQAEEGTPQVGPDEFGQRAASRPEPQVPPFKAPVEASEVPGQHQWRLLVAQTATHCHSAQMELPHGVLPGGQVAGGGQVAPPAVQTSSQLNEHCGPRPPSPPPSSGGMHWLLPWNMTQLWPDGQSLEVWQGEEQKQVFVPMTQM